MVALFVANFPWAKLFSVFLPASIPRFVPPFPVLARRSRRKHFDRRQLPNWTCPNAVGKAGEGAAVSVDLQPETQ
jgi:hypothetical protein